jgi:hypothetical protein
LDDHSHYGHDNDHTAHESEDSDSTDVEEKENPDSGEIGPNSRIEPEVINGVEDQRDVDVEALEKSKSRMSRKSERDPNLVAWDGPDDKANPKNWSSGRKWAATFVGRFCCLK